MHGISVHGRIRTKDRSGTIIISLIKSITYVLQEGREIELCWVNSWYLMYPLLEHAEKHMHACVPTRKHQSHLYYNTSRQGGIAAKQGSVNGGGQQIWYAVGAIEKIPRTPCGSGWQVTINILGPNEKFFLLINGMCKICWVLYVF